MIKLNLGCKQDIREGYLNYDIFPRTDDILYIDLEDMPLPFDDDSIDEILLYSVLEHLFINPIVFMKEMHRILKPDGIIKIRLPLFYPMITHIRCFHARKYFSNIIQWKYKNNPDALFKQLKVTTRFSKFIMRFPFIILRNDYLLQKI